MSDPGVSGKPCRFESNLHVNTQKEYLCLDMFWYVLDAGFTEIFSQTSWDYTSKTGKYAASSFPLLDHIHHKLGVTKNGVFKMRSYGPMDLFVCHEGAISLRFQSWILCSNKIHAESVFFFVEKKSFQKDRVFTCHGCNKINGLMATDVFSC